MIPRNGQLSEIRLRNLIVPSYAFKKPRENWLIVDSCKTSADEDAVNLNTYHL